MKHLVLGCAISMALLGCATTETVVFDANNVSEVAESYSQIQWIDVEPTKRVNFSINERNQKYQFASGISPIAAFNINTQGKDLDLEIISHFKKTVFYPNAVLLNENNQILKTFTTEDFEYQHAYGLDGDRLTAEVTIQPVGEQRVKLLLYTTPALIEEKSEIMHPVKLDAIARGNYPPDVPNPLIPHAQYGELSIVAKVDSAILVEEPLTVSSTDTAHQKFKEELAKNQPVLEKKELIPVMGTSLAVASPATLSAEQQQFYLSSIENAVKVGMLDKALALLEEAKALNVEGAQQVFVSAVNSK
ncbi:MalM family protein [Vibrio japonicus]|uniref:MalM family protein n=1 Tax=Vibrio japonicus TaxID=1824638 RepID=A0ABY5LMD6_9VIBR|nr:MalM family protein [Vibrio japonicus]UUM32070.1 MalM family protein [Vibrio japonicus]